MMAERLLCLGAAAGIRGRRGHIMQAAPHAQRG